MLHVHKIAKSYGKKNVLHDISFHIEKGEVVGLVGENGAGKSTLLHILASMVKQTSGSFTIDGESDKHPARIRKKIGFVPQDIALWEDFTVKENMKFFFRHIPMCRSLFRHVVLGRPPSHIVTEGHSLCPRLACRLQNIATPRFTFFHMLTTP